MRRSRWLVGLSPFALVCGTGLSLAGGSAAAETHVPSRVIQLRPGERTTVLSAARNRVVFYWHGSDVTEVEGVADDEGPGLKFTLSPGEYTAYDMYAGHSRNREKLLVRSSGAAPLSARPRATPAETAETSPKPPRHARAAARSTAAPANAPWTAFFRAVVATGRRQLGTLVAAAGRDL
jgi:hypothetical protein